MPIEKVGWMSKVFIACDPYTSKYIESTQDQFNWFLMLGQSICNGLHGFQEILLIQRDIQTIWNLWFINTSMISGINAAWKP